MITCFQTVHDNFIGFLRVCYDDNWFLNNVYIDN